MVGLVGSVSSWGTSKVGGGASGLFNLISASSLSNLILRVFLDQK